MNISKNEIEEKIKSQIALEFNCVPQDFVKSENTITAAYLNPNRRKFSDKPHHMFAPEPKIIEINTDLRIEWLEQNDITQFYGNENFPNAICNKFKPERPDVLAVVAMDGEKIMGMAGCSADTPDLWQIGIDVLPEYRGRGVAKTLVTLLRNETFRRGAIPYYGTGLSNLASWKTALECGFRPFWVEAESQPDEKLEFTK